MAKDLSRYCQGSAFVLRYLNDNDSQEIIAGDLAEAMGVSTARIAVILNELEGTGSIKKYKSLKDKRITVVRLTEQGRRDLADLERDIVQMVRSLIRQMGEDEFLQFIQLSNKIASILECDTEKTNTIR